MTLTPEQREVAELPAEDCALVIAGPGTGKTHLLIARIAQLITRDKLKAGTEILVLSFSRAAVAEVRRRVKAAGGKTRFVKAVTFDSFATRLLAEYCEEEWSKWDYDKRIEKCTALIGTSEKLQERLELYEHIFIDEIQDLVAARAEFIAAVLEYTNCGFTLLGDPAQGIYGFQIKGDARYVSTTSFVPRVQSEYDEHIKTYQLTENHRAVTETARIALWAGAELNSATPNFSAVKRKLEASINRLPSLRDVATAVPFLKRTELTTAILCRDNGQALLISAELIKNGLDHRLQRAAIDRVVPRWLARASASLAHGRITKKIFDMALQDDFADTEALWRLLRRTCDSNVDSVEIDVLRERIQTKNLPDELMADLPAKLMVSTIHKSKGLEYQSVIIVDPRDNGPEEDLAEGTRLLYVALTRPTHDLRHINSPDCKNLYRNNGGRWTMKTYGYDNQGRIELLSKDMDSPLPPMTHLGVDMTKHVQEYLQTEVEIMDPVELIATATFGAKDEPIFDVVHRDMRIARTTVRFGSDVRWFVGPNYSQRLRRITGIHVDAVETVVGEKSASEEAGLGGSGIWASVRLGGLGTLHMN